MTDSSSECDIIAIVQVWRRLCDFNNYCTPPQSQAEFRETSTLQY